MSSTLTLSASGITRRLRAAGVDVATSHTITPGAVRTWLLQDEQVGAARAALMQAGYDVATASGYTGALIVTLPEPEQQDEPQPATRISTDEQLRDRLMASGATAERAAMVVAARNQLQRELTAAAPAIAAVLAGDPDVHLMGDDLLDACGTAAVGPLHTAPFTTPERITCPACRPLADAERRQVLEQDHADALAEDAAHDAAASTAQDLTPELLERYADAPVPMPRALRHRVEYQRRLQLAPPR